MPCTVPPWDFEQSLLSAWNTPCSLILVLTPSFYTGFWGPPWPWHWNSFLHLSSLHYPMLCYILMCFSLSALAEGNLSRVRTLFCSLLCISVFWNCVWHILSTQELLTERRDELTHGWAEWFNYYLGRLISFFMNPDFYLLPAFSLS